MDQQSLSSAEHKRNFRLGVANGLLYITAETVMDPTLVMVAFLSHLTSSPLLLGLVLPIRDGAWSLPQLWVSGYLQSVPHKLTFYRWVSVFRVATWILVALSMNSMHDPNTLLWLFFTAFVISSFANGLGGLPFLEVVGKTIPAERRGEYFAWRFGLGGLGSIGASILVRWILDPSGPLPFPYNYGSLSIAFLILGGISLLAFGMIKEPVDTIVLPRQSLPDQLRRGIHAARDNPRYLAFLALQSLLMLAGSATPFFAVYVQQNLGGSTAMIGVYLAVLTATNLGANAFFGRMSRKTGNGPVMLAGVAAGISMSVLVLLLGVLAGPLHLNGGLASAWLIPVFVLSGVRGSAMGVATNSLMLDIAPEADRSLYLGFTNTLLGLVLFATGLSGVIVNIFGFLALVIFTLAAHVLAFWAGRLMQARKNEVVRPERTTSFN